MKSSYHSASPLARRIVAASLSIAAASSLHAQSGYIFQAPTGPGGTWNIYQFDPTGRTFKDANIFAEAAVNPVTGSGTGHLVSIGNLTENDAIWNASGRTDTWIGLTDRDGAAPGAFESSTTADPFTMGWAWTSGEPFTFNHWGGGEPNDFNGAEDAAQIRGDGFWNDHVSGYGVDDPIAPAIPGTSNDETAGPLFRSVLEWNVASPTPFANVRSGAMLGFQNSLPGPTSTVAGWGVREIRGLPQAANLVDAYNLALSGTGTITEGNVSVLNVADPDTNGGGGPALSAAPLPFLSNVAGTDDDAILSVVKGSVVVPSAGTYTVQVRSDDGFAFRINGATFSSVNGAGSIDPLDASTIFFYNGTGDADTRGVLTLAAGTYEIEYLHFEGGGGAYYEVTTAKGAFTSAHGANWIGMGDGRVVTNPLRLDAPATVHTIAGATANLADARAAIAAAETAGTTNNSTVDVAILDGGEDGSLCCGRPGGGIIAQASPFPANTPAADFSTRLFGSFTLDDGDGTPGESLTLSFGLYSDDGSQLHIFGQNFLSAIDFTGDGDAALQDLNGDMTLIADYATGNTNAMGLITLTEGSYNFEAFERQGGGDAGLEVWYAIGDKTGTGFDDTFLPLSTAGTNEGWAVVPEPASAALALMGAPLLAMRRRRRTS